MSGAPSLKLCLSSFFEQNIQRPHGGDGLVLFQEGLGGRVDGALGHGERVVRMPLFIISGVGGDVPIVAAPSEKVDRPPVLVGEGRA